MSQKETERWSLAENTLLELLILSDASHEQIALRLGRTRNAVQQQAKKRGLSLRKNSQEAKKARREAWLRQDEESLAQYLPECSEAPVRASKVSRGTKRLVLT